MRHVVGNIFVREGRLDKAESVTGHKHNFDHVTYIPIGRIKVEKLNEQGEVERTVIKEAGEGNWVLIKAGITHRLTGLADVNVYHCVYSLRNKDGEVAEEYTGWDNAYK